MDDIQILEKLDAQCDQYIRILRDIMQLSDELKQNWNTKSGRIFSDSLSQTLSFSLRAAMITQGHLSQQNVRSDNNNYSVSLLKDFNF
ncbi:MAG: hypothetical protein Q4F95_15945 [Oscillospiraceae bacterium]|nr:hypothetical protein [Oscillospiraceae bacterium]